MKTINSEDFTRRLKAVRSSGYDHRHSANTSQGGENEALIITSFQNAVEDAAHGCGSCCTNTMNVATKEVRGVTEYSDALIHVTNGSRW